MKTAPPITCCQAIPDVASHEVSDALLTKLLVAEYYDGAAGGFLQCPVCGSVYQFITLDWSDNHLVRVIALSLLPPDSMTRLEAFFSEAPTRSPWIPKMLLGAKDQDLDRIEPFLAEVTAQAEPPSIILAWNLSTNEVISARRISALSRDHFVSLFDLDAPAPPRRVDWFAELGLTRDR
jgi:hypothetical protein